MTPTRPIWFPVRDVADRLALIQLYTLLVLGSLALHEVRYALPSGQALDANHGGGHGYLVVVGPLVGMIAALVLATVVLRAAVVSRSRSRASMRARRAWPLLTAGVFGLYAGQEVVEGLLSHHHPDGVAAVFGAGGWFALPVAAVIGAALALTVRVADAVVRRAHRAANLLQDVRLVLPPATTLFCVERLAFPRPVPPRHRAGRGPPHPV